MTIVTLDELLANIASLESQLANEKRAREEAEARLAEANRAREEAELKFTYSRNAHKALANGYLSKLALIEYLRNALKNLSARFVRKDWELRQADASIQEGMREIFSLRSDLVQAYAS